jgi:uncharacterized protein YbjT (DUF2867 family)
MTIAVHGATGSQGAPLAAHLTDAGHDVRPLSSANADLLDRASLEAAYAGADAVVLQFPLVYDARALTMAHNAARAAEAAGIRHLVVNAGGPFGHEPIGVPFVDARHRAASADVPLVTLLQPTVYLENLSAPWSTVLDGVLAYPRPVDTVIQWVATADIARAAAQVLEHGLGGRFSLPGEPLDGHQLAAALAEGLERPVRYEQIAPAAFGERLRPHLGDHAAYGTAAVYELPHFPSPPSTLTDWVPTPAGVWAREAFGVTLAA